MAFCPNKNLIEWKNLVKARGENMAYYLWNKYEGNVPTEEYVSQPEDTELAEEEAEEIKAEEKKANAALYKKVYGFLDRIGVDVQRVENIVVNGRRYDAAAVADFTNNIIQYTKGNEQALTAETMHFALEILEQTNPDLFNAMLAKIGKYQVYQDVFNTYATNPHYQTADGRPDIRKIKKEAIGKKLADLYVEKVYEDSHTNDNMFLMWWLSVKKFFQDLFNWAGFDPFEEGVAKIISEDVGGTVEDIESEGVMFELNEYPKQQSFIQKILTTPIKPTQDGYDYNNEKVPIRVTDIVAKVYEQMFRNRDLNKDEYTKAVNDIKKDYGDDIHEDIRHILSKELLNADGTLRKDDYEDPTYVAKTSDAIYRTLKSHLLKRLELYEKKYEGMRFLVERSVFNGKDTGGTIDFMGVTRQGKVLLLDWKSFDISTDIYKDVPWYKQRAWRRQLLEYKKILMENYGLRQSDFLEETAAIPIKANYTYVKYADQKYYPRLKSLTIGDADVSLIEQDYLLPVPVDQAVTEDRVLNKFLSKLRGLRENIQEKTTTTAEQRFAKGEQLQALDKALRHIVVKHSIEPLLDQASIFTKEISELFDTYDAMYADKDFKTLTKAQWEEANNFSRKLDRAFDEIDIYTNLDNDLKPILQKLNKEKGKTNQALGRRIDKVVSDARMLRSEMEGLANEMATKIGESENLADVTRVEKQLDTASKMFSLTSKIQKRTLQVFYKKRAQAQNKMDFDTRDQNEDLEKIRESFMKLADSKGWTPKTMFDILVKKGTNKLVDQYDEKFYKDAKDALKAKNYQWIKDNVDVAAFEKALEEELQRKVKYLADSLNFTDDEEGQERRKKAIEQAIDEYSLATPDSSGWYLHYEVLRNFPKKDKWESQEWKAMHSAANEIVVDGKKVNPVLDLYNWILNTNEKADNSGYLPEGKVKRNFLPFVAKSLVERITFGGNITLGEQFLRNITVDEDTIGYGEIDKMSNKLVKRIPRYFTNPSDKELSTDLFRNLALYNASVNRFKYLSEIEGIALLLGRVERNKGAIQTSYWGRPKRDRDTDELVVIENNDKDADFYDRQIATLVYDQKYIESEQFDILMGKVGNVFEKANKFLGFKVFPENLVGRQVSMNRLLDTANSYFQQTKLGLNPLSAISNALGGKANAIMLSGRYFNKRDLFKSEYELSSKAFSGEYGEKLVAATKYFMPFTDDLNRDLARKLSVGAINPATVQDVLFSFMRTGDRFIQSTIFLSNLRNQIVIDGKIYNAREYVRQQPEYKNRYNNPAELRRIESEFDSKVEELINKHGLLNISKVENGKLVIPGVDSQSEGVFRIRDLTKDLTTKVLGNLTPEQVRGVQQNIYYRSLMVFRNWIPSLVDVRYGALKYDAATDAYEWGRHRVLARYIFVNGIRSAYDLLGAIQGTERGLESLRKLYEYKAKAYEEATGQPFDMSEEDFYDMVRLNLRQSAKDFLITATAIGAVIGLAASGIGDDEEDARTKNLLKFTKRFLDKVTDEVSFFYNPTSAQQILNGSIFPSAGILTDFIKIMNHTAKELYGFTVDENLQEENHVLKYVFKAFPVTNQMAGYLPLYAPGLAKSLGIEMSTQSRLR